MVFDDGQMQIFRNGKDCGEGPGGVPIGRALYAVVDLLGTCEEARDEDGESRIAWDAHACFNQWYDIISLLLIMPPSYHNRVHLSRHEST